MSKEISIAGVDKVLFSHRRSLRLEVRPGAQVLLRAPLGTDPQILASFVRDNAAWLVRARDKMQAQALSRQQSYAEGAAVYYLGQLYPLQLRAEPGLHFDKQKGFLLAKDGVAQGRTYLEAFYRQQTRELVQRFLSFHAPRWGLSHTSLRISAAKTRWGSCSSSNSLNFSYRLAMTPTDCIEYVVVHELAHTRHHNHSASFWSLVEQILPNFRERRHRLACLSRELPSL